MRTTSRARSLCAASRSRAASSRSESSQTAATKASSVAGCAATDANIPGAVVSTLRIAAATTGAETGRRCFAAKRGAAKSSANRDAVRKLTPIRPVPTLETGPSSPEASSRRTATPTEFPGTTTVTGASGDSCFARAISPRSASLAAPPVRSGDDPQ